MSFEMWRIQKEENFISIINLIEFEVNLKNKIHEIWNNFNFTNKDHTSC